MLAVSAICTWLSVSLGRKPSCHHSSLTVRRILSFTLGPTICLRFLTIHAFLARRTPVAQVLLRRPSPRATRSRAPLQAHSRAEPPHPPTHFSPVHPASVYPTPHLTCDDVGSLSLSSTESAQGQGGSACVCAVSAAVSVPPSVGQGAGGSQSRRHEQRRSDQARRSCTTGTR